MKSIWFFEDVNLFNILCPHKIENYKKEHKFNSYKKEDYIYFENDSASKIYLIEKGKVKIGYYNKEGDEIIKSILTKGELFGETAILGSFTRDEFAQSIDNNTSICPIDTTTMLSLMRENQNFSLKIYKFIGFRFKKLERRLQLLLFKDAKTRLLEFLEELATDYGHECSNTGDKIIKHPYTQKDMASLIGISRPTINILMNELKEEKIIDFNRKELKILKKELKNSYM